MWLTFDGVGPRDAEKGVEPVGVSEEAKTIARAAAAAFGVDRPPVFKYLHDNSQSYVSILFAPDRPSKGVTAYSTIGVSEHSIGVSVENVPLRVEFVGACASKFEKFPNILATCAFYVINSKFKCKPGVVYRDVIPMYVASSDMKHILFVSPFLWEGKLRTLDLPDKKVAWLLVIPISEAERQYAAEKGEGALETLFEEHQIDIFDLNRSSIL